MTRIKCLTLASGIFFSLFIGCGYAETGAPAAQPPHSMMQPGQPPANPMTEIQLTAPQKLKMGAWRKLQQQHMQDMMKNQDTIEELASADKLDESAIKQAAEKMAAETQQYYVEYAQKHHDFLSSLTPEQREKMKTIRSERKQQMKMMRERMQQQMKNPPPEAAQKPAASPAK